MDPPPVANTYAAGRTNEAHTGGEVCVCVGRGEQRDHAQIAHPAGTLDVDHTRKCEGIFRRCTWSACSLGEMEDQERENEKPWKVDLAGNLVCSSSVFIRFSMGIGRSESNDIDVSYIL